MPLNQQYFKDSSHEVLSDYQEKELIRKYQESGDTEARKKLIEHNLRLVMFVASEYKGTGHDYADLVQAGNIGLIKSLEKFDPDKGFRFSTYATWWIRQKIFRELTDHSRQIRLPEPQYRRLHKIQQTQEKFKDEHGREPSREELAEELEDMDIEQIKKVLNRGRITNFLDSEVSEDEPYFSNSLKDIVAKDEEKDPAKLAERELKIEHLWEALDEAPTERERHVLVLRFGLKDGNSRTLEETGEVFDISRERTRQIQNKGLEKLREALGAEEIRVS